MTDQSFDMTALSAKHTEADSARRIRRRRRAGIRLRAYGIFAIALAISALLVLIYTIAVQTYSVLNERYVAIDVKLDLAPEVVEKYRKDQNTAAIEKADISDFHGTLGPSVLTAMKAAIGGKINPRYENQLLELLSFTAPKVTTAEVELINRLRSDASLIGQSVKVRALLDDTAQLFFMGRYGAREDAGAEGALKIDTQKSSRRRIALILGPTALGNARARMREVRAQQAAYIRADEVKRQQFAVQVAKQKMADTALSEKEREQWKNRLAGYEQNLQAAIKKADALSSKATDPSAVFKLKKTD